MRTVALAVVLALGVGGSRQTPAQGPPCRFEINPAVGHLRAIADVVRRKDLAELRRFLDSEWSKAPEAADARESAVVGLSRLALQSDGLSEIRVCTPPSDDVAIGVFRNALTDTADQVAVRVSGDSGTPITLVQIASATRLLRPVGDTDETHKLRELDTYLRRLADRGAFSGVVMVGQQGAVLYSGVFGSANRERRIPVSLETPFNVASASKIMTAVAVMQLVEQGALSLEDTVAGILPSASRSPAFSAIRVKHLLSHTSGLDRDPDVLAFTPGTSFLYSNLGFRLLGDVVATRTHMRFEDYLRLRVLGPGGMASTGRYELDGVSPWLTYGYTLENLDNSGGAATVPTWNVNPYLHTISGGAMGGLYSTGPDLLRFADALLGGRLVKPETLEMMKAPKVELGATSYGYGVMRERTPGVWGHGGDLPGADAALEFYSNNRVAIVLANMDKVSAPILQLTRALFHSASDARTAGPGAG